MQLHEIKPKNKRKAKKRVGRGGKRGSYCGRGMKGQKSRSGSSKEPIIRGLIKRYPKLRGYRLGNRQEVIAIVNLALIEKEFKEDETVSPTTLIKKRIIRKIKGRVPKVKILATGDLNKKLTIKDCFVSEQAKKKIEKKGGKIIL